MFDLNNPIKILKILLKRVANTLTLKLKVKRKSRSHGAIVGV